MKFNLSVKVLIIVFLVLLVFSVVGVGWFLKNKKADSGASDKGVNKAEVQYSEAEKIVRWMDNSRDNEGIFYQAIVCNKENKECNNRVETGDSGHTSLPVIWAKFLLLQKGSAVIDRNVFSQDLEKYWKIGNFQNDFWNCKMMEQLVNSSLLTDKEKQMAKNICVDGTYSYTSGMKTEIINDVVTAVVKNKINGTNGDDLLLLPYFVAYPSDLISRYNLWKSENDLKLAKHYFETAEYFYQNDPSYFGPQDICLLGISALDMFDHYGENKYEKFAIDLAKKTLVSQEVGWRYNRPVCGIWGEQLTKVTGDLVYGSRVKEIVDDYNKNQIDDGALKIAIIGDGIYFDKDSKGDFV